MPTPISQPTKTRFMLNRMCWCIRFRPMGWTQDWKNCLITTKGLGKNSPIFGFREIRYHTRIKTTKANVPKMTFSRLEPAKPFVSLLMTCAFLSQPRVQ